MKQNTKKNILCVVAGFVVINIASLANAGYQWAWGPFAGLHDIKVANYPGNAADYNLETVEKKTDSPLEGKTILFLGSSVTYGAASQQVSFADYIQAETGCIAVKEAVSGTTLVDEGVQSYISRLEKIKAADVDLVVCQLSTNDATQNKTLGEVTGSNQKSDYDTHTVAGAMEYIVSYSRETWNDCPVIFYTNPRYDSDVYGQMVDLVHEVDDKWNTPIIDMWNDEVFNQITEEQRALYMADNIHPTKAGYLEWWTPYMEEQLEILF